MAISMTRKMGAIEVLLHAAWVVLEATIYFVSQLVVSVLYSMIQKE